MSAYDNPGLQVDGAVPPSNGMVSVSLDGPPPEYSVSLTSRLTPAGPGLSNQVRTGTVAGSRGQVSCFTQVTGDSMETGLEGLYEFLIRLSPRMSLMSHR